MFQRGRKRSGLWWEPQGRQTASGAVQGMGRGSYQEDTEKASQGKGGKFAGGPDLATKSGSGVDVITDETYLVRGLTYPP